MITKKIIAFICLLLLSTQALPVKQLGSMLFGNQINEELATSHTGEDVAKDPCKTDPFIVSTQANNHFAISKISVYIHFTSLLPLNHAGDIHTPPPNAA